MSTLTINFPNKEMRQTFMELMKTGGLEEDVFEGLHDFTDEFIPEGIEEYDIAFSYPSADTINITLDY
jgi:hypothetical protein